MIIERASDFHLHGDLQVKHEDMIVRIKKDEMEEEWKVNENYGELQVNSSQWQTWRLDCTTQKERATLFFMRKQDVEKIETVECLGI